MSRPKAPPYYATLYAVEQTLRHGRYVERRLAEDPATGIPYLYTKDKCDPGQLEYGMEKYVRVKVSVLPG